MVEYFALQRSVVLIGAALASLSCSPSSALLNTPSLSDGIKRGQCNASSASHLSPMVVDWDTPDRAKIEALSRDGVMAISYVDCNIRVLPQCHAPGKYRYMPTTLAHDTERISSADDLYVKLPFTAISLQGTLSRAGTLAVAMSIVGQYQAERREINDVDLIGSCDGVTHVVVALTTGAFTFAAGARAEVKADASAGVFGAGDQSSVAEQTLRTDGFERACQQSTLSDIAPPAGCGAIVRLEMMPLPGTQRKMAVAEDQWRADRHDAATRRAWGWGVGTSGVALLAGGGIFAVLGAQNNRSIQNGGFATANDLTSAESRGATYNTLGYLLGVSGGLLLATGGALIYFSPEPNGPRIGLAPLRTFAASGLMLEIQ